MVKDELAQLLEADDRMASFGCLLVARKLAAIVLSMWKNNEEYDPTKHRKQGS